MKLCKDCKYAVPDPVFPDLKWLRCARTVNVVTGGAKEACHLERYFGWLACRVIDQSCGKEGRFWEPKE